MKKAIDKRFTTSRRAQQADGPTSSGPARSSWDPRPREGERDGGWPTVPKRLRPGDRTTSCRQPTCARSSEGSGRPRDDLSEADRIATREIMLRNRRRRLASDRHPHRVGSNAGPLHDDRSRRPISSKKKPGHAERAVAAVKENRTGPREFKGDAGFRTATCMFCANASDGVLTAHPYEAKT
jgi:hypothetical protein